VVSAHHNICVQKVYTKHLRQFVNKYLFCNLNYIEGLHFSRVFSANILIRIICLIFKFTVQSEISLSGSIFKVLCFCSLRFLFHLEVLSP